LNGSEVKPAASVKCGDTVSYREPPIWKDFEVLGIPKSRVGAKLVPELIVETTSWEELEKLEIAVLAQKQERPRGAGRPTKRERRDLDRLKD
jgi:ribosome-associated heat shock protein Hsp15